MTYLNQLSEFASRPGIQCVMVYNIAARMWTHAPEAFDTHYATALVKMIGTGYSRDLHLIVGELRYSTHAMGPNHVLCVVIESGHPIGKSLSRVVKRFSDKYMGMVRTGEKIGEEVDT